MPEEQDQDQFYNLKSSDFAQIPTTELKIGDELMFRHSRGSKEYSDEYGSVRVEGIEIYKEIDIIELRYILPAGAWTRSSRDITITISWPNGQQLIEVKQDSKLSERIFIRRK